MVPHIARKQDDQVIVYFHQPTASGTPQTQILPSDYAARMDSYGIPRSQPVNTCDGEETASSSGFMTDVPLHPRLSPLSIPGRPGATSSAIPSHLHLCLNIPVSTCINHKTNYESATFTSSRCQCQTESYTIIIMLGQSSVALLRY